MRAKTNAVVIVVALLVYWVGLCNASAFYDPCMQRWPNQDPIGEVGFHVLKFTTESVTLPVPLTDGRRGISLDPLRVLAFEQIRHSLLSRIRTFRSFSEIKEGLDLYEFVNNSPVSGVDFFGLDASSDCVSQCNQNLISCMTDLTSTAGYGAGVLRTIQTGGGFSGAGFAAIVSALPCYSALFGCLSGCPPPSCPSAPPPANGCSTCNENNPSAF